jgi:hypothetical protein
MGKERGFKGTDDTRKSFIEYMGDASSNFKQGLNEDETGADAVDR